MRVHVGSSNPVKREAVRRVFARVFEGALEVRLVDVATEVPEQPVGETVARGAIARARGALHEADFGVGVEAGLVWNEVCQVYFDVQFCAVVDREGVLTVGQGPGFTYPERIVQEVLSRGQTVGEAMQELTGIAHIGRRMGAIGYLTHQLIDRTELTESAVLMALVPRIEPELYRAGPRQSR